MKRRRHEGKEERKGTGIQRKRKEARSERETEKIEEYEEERTEG